MFHSKTIILNTLKAAVDLLDSRSSIYSDRPIMWMTGELAGQKSMIFMTRFSDPCFKSLRRLLQEGLNTRASKSYRPIQMHETQVLLQGLMNNPEAFATHIRRYRFFFFSQELLTPVIQERGGRNPESCIWISDRIER